MGSRGFRWNPITTAGLHVQQTTQRGFKGGGRPSFTGCVSTTADEGNENTERNQRELRANSRILVQVEQKGTWTTTVWLSLSEYFFGTVTKRTEIKLKQPRMTLVCFERALNSARWLFKAGKRREDLERSSLFRSALLYCVQFTNTTSGGGFLNFFIDPLL